MGKKTKPFKIEIEVPDHKHMSHITNAYGLVCQYRTANKVPHEKMEAWLLRLVVEGCNALYNFHNQQLLAQQEKQKTKDSEQPTEKDTVKSQEGENEQQ